jgi:hypothetical protein
MRKHVVRILLVVSLAALSVGLTSCESSGGGTSTVHVSVHGGYGYGPGWGWGGGYYPGSPVGPYW